MTDELEPELRAALRAEAYRSPVVLTAAALRTRLETNRHRLRRSPRAWLAAAAATVTIALVAATASFLPILRPGGDRTTPSASAECADSPATTHGSWWVEIGGPNAFFNIEPGSLWANTDASTWLVHTRFDPDAVAGQTVAIYAERIDTGERVDGSFNGPTDPANIYRFDEPGPQLPGGWYLFEQRFPSAGCWLLSATIDDRIVGTAILKVGPGRAAPSLDPNAPSPMTASEAPTPGSAELGTGEITERYSDGLPKRIGDSAVMRGLDALEFAASRSDSESFLVAGWVTFWGLPTSCPYNPQPWIGDCGRPRFADLAGDESVTMADSITFRYVLDETRTGPVVAVVHVRDPRATECGSAEGECSAMMVVERIVWSGDSETTAGPLDATEIADALRTAQGSTDVVPLGDDPIRNCGELLPAAAVYTVNTGHEMMPGVTLVQLEATSDALRRALDLAPGVESALTSDSVVCNVLTNSPPSSSGTYRWFLIENAALLVRTNSDPTAKDRALSDSMHCSARQRSADGPRC